jgi:transketolase
MRKAFIQTLTGAAVKNPHIILLTGDLGFTVFEEYKTRLPGQFINIGVAEQNMIGIATGLALTGKTVFCYSIASFITTRVYEQIKLDVAAHKARVIIVGTGAGLSYSTASITHQSLDDIALMKLIPGMTIFAPGDNTETAWAVNQSLNIPGPVYIRLGKNEERDLYTRPPKFKIGRGNIISRGENIAIIGSGTAANIAKDTAEILRQHKLFPTVISLPTVKPFDEKLIGKLLPDHQLIITIEEHGLNGGIGSSVLETVARNGLNAKIMTFGAPDKFIFKNGTLENLRSCIGINPVYIAKKIQTVYNHSK